MIGTNFRQRLIIARNKKNDEQHVNCFMSSIICSGASQLTDAESHLKNEINWLSSKYHEKQNNFGAVLYHNSEDDFENKNNINDKINSKALKNCQNMQTIELINNPKYLKAISETNDINSAKILLACSYRNSEDNLSSWIPPYTHEDRVRGVCYSMILDGEIQNLDDLLRLDGFNDWLYNFRPEMLITDYSNSSEYFFLWLVKSVQDNDGDVLNGLYKGLISLSCNKIGGQFNLFFSDGRGVFTYSNMDYKSEQRKLISYKVTRNEQNIFNYTLRNYCNPVDTDWIMTKTQKLYYFPILGAIQSCYDLSEKQETCKTHNKTSYCVSFSSLIFSSF